VHKSLIISPLFSSGKDREQLIHNFDLKIFSTIAVDKLSTRFIIKWYNGFLSTFEVDDLPTGK